MAEVFLYTEEWNEDEPMIVNVYGLVSEEQSEDIIEQMKRWSPFDYCNYQTMTKKEEFESMLGVIERDSDCVVKYVNNH